MKCSLGAAAFALALFPTLLAAQAPANLQNPQIDIAYVQPANPSYRSIQERLKKLADLEQLQAFLVPLKLPRKLTMQVDQCGGALRPYTSGGAATICYEL